MYTYRFKMAGHEPEKVFSIKASNWKAACDNIKKQFPNCGWINRLETIDMGDFDDAGRIGKESYSWQNRHRYR